MPATAAPGISYDQRAVEKTEKRKIGRAVTRWSKQQKKSDKKVLIDQTNIIAEREIENVTSHQTDH